MRKRRKKHLKFFWPEIISLILLIFGFGQTLNAQKKYTVLVTSNRFTPSELKINVGDTVEWKNTEGFHNVNGTIETYPLNPESFGNNTGVGWTYRHVFTIAGNYNYHCNPHVKFGMKGTITVQPVGSEKHSVSVNFSEMGLFAGVNLWLRVHNQETGEEIDRVKEVVDSIFSIKATGLETGVPYFVDFFVDHNRNGRCKVSGGTPIWRIPLDNVSADTTLSFKYDSVFANIEWKYKLTFNFKNMTPHLGQKLNVFLIDIFDESHVDTMQVDSITASDFTVVSYKINWGDAYELDFYVDNNNNGKYDSPPVDHAWRYPLYSVLGDTTITFSHTTNFTDIKLTTGIYETKSKSLNINVYPNPVVNKLYIPNFSEGASMFYLQFYNSSGQVVKNSVVNQSDIRSGVDVSQLNSGIYILKIYSEGKFGVVKFVKQDTN